MVTRHDGNTDLLVDIWLKASVKAHNFIDKSFWESKTEQMKNVYLPSADNYVWTEENGTVCGFISVRDNHIEALFVTPEHQGKGIGRRLLDHVKQISSGDITLNVFERNGKAVMFYHRNKFAVIEERKDDTTGEYELLMVYTPS